MGARTARNSLVALIGFVLLLAGSLLVAQAQRAPRGGGSASGSPAIPRMKGIFEPVSYPEDVELADVFFADERTGWVAGGTSVMKGGILLHTRDRGDSWEVQLGDPKSSERGFKDLRFLDGTHGWVVQGAPLDAKLFHTTDGKAWRLAGSMETHYADYAFTSDANGVYVMGEKIFATQDGGRSWKDVLECKGRVVIEGLAREKACDWQRVQFVTASVGFAIGSVPDVDIVFVAKTADGGSTWSLSSASVKGDPRDAFFVDALTGYVRTGYPDSGQLFRTADGGRTWSAITSSPVKRIQFADPGVGWAFQYRNVPLPASVNAFSFPRRDAAFLVGDHGMVYRYRVVPTDYKSKGMIAAALMPAAEGTSR